jgi:heme/copper-type cytochrome/quinol oxidase subunit 2
MGIGVSIFLIAVGGILAFAVDFRLWWFDVNMAGWVLIVVGVLAMLMTLLLWGRRRSGQLL